MKKITDYKPLHRNPNKGTQKGAGIIDESVRTLGAGRSLLVDKDGVIIAGNHAQEAFVNAGMENVIEVETDGSQIVVVKRTDMTADSVAGKKMAIMDNRASELGLAWDEVILEEMMEEISAEDGKLCKFLDDLQYELDPPEIDYDEMWKGMPEFEQEDLSSMRQIIVHFEKQSDIDEFSKIMGQAITEKTKYIWFPKKENMNLKELVMHDES